MAEILKQKLYTSKQSEKPYEHWWTVDTPHADMIQLAKALEENQKERRVQDLRHGYLYQNRQSADIITGMSDYARSLPSRFNVTYNVIKSSIDTLTSRIAQSKPRPRILTEKGDYAKQRRAELLTRYLDGTFSSAQIHRLASRAFKDGGIFGTGVIKILVDPVKGRIDAERVLITEILVDELEGAYDNPRSMYQVRLVSKDVLLSQFPEKADDINATMPDSAVQKKLSYATEMVKVYEGWHLADNNGKGGRHVLAVENATLVDEEWRHDCFPFAFFRYNTAIASFYGQGIAEELSGTQLEINKLLRDIQRAQNLIAVPRVLMEYNSKVVASHLNNEIGSAIKYQGTAPKFINPTAMNNEIYSHVKWLIQTAYEKIGISQLSATSKKPSGLDSGRALREFNSIESERFAETSNRWNDFHEDIASLVLRFSKDLYEAHPDLEITTENKQFIEKIKWKDACLEDDRFVSRMYISAILPTTPAAKLQKVQEYIQAGWMDRDTGIKLLDFPDTEAWASSETASVDYTEKIITSILGDGKYLPPEPELVLEKSIDRVRKAYLEALANGASEERLEMLLRWIDAAASLLPELQTPVAPQMAAPQAAPEALPTGELLPNVQG